MKVLGRDVSKVLKAAGNSRYYRAIYRSTQVYSRPLDGIQRYLFKKGEYPTKIELKTPIGLIDATLHCPDDMLTVNEIFCRGDYTVADDIKVVVDFGSNIGLSALFFLSRNKEVFCYLYEPLPQNYKHLKENLANFSTRYLLSENAVGVAAGEVSFGYEPTGRYGGIGKSLTSTMTVACEDSAEVVDSILAKHKTIDVLKIDVESQEKEIFAHLGRQRLENVKLALIEQQYTSNPYPDIFRFEQIGSIARFENLMYFKA